MIQYIYWPPQHLLQYYRLKEEKCRTDKEGIDDNLGIIFVILMNCNSNEHPQHMFLWRTIENHPTISVLLLNLSPEINKYLTE